MIDQLIMVGLSNTCFALLLAIVAMLVGARAERSHLAHLLWLLVLAKLVTPPLVSIPVDLLARSPDSASMRVPLDDAALNPPVAQARGDSFLFYASSVWNRVTPWLGAVWLLGSGVVLTWSLVRVFQFNRLLGSHTETPPPELLTTAADVAGRLELRSVPELFTTTANISPMVWWTGGRVRVVIPSSLLQRLERRQWRWVLAHELAHVRRRDHLVRWLEWLARVGFWWNPVVWWAQRNLRAMEEICCDSLVISTLQPEPRTYANSILTAVESLARPILRPPAMASEINSGGSLERRFSMMVSNSVDRSNSGWQQACVLLCAMAVLPFGVVYAQDYEAVGKRLRAAVEADEISGEQARIMMGALKHAEERGERTEKSITREDYAAAEAKLKAMVREGEASEEDVRARLGAMRRMMAKQHEGRGKSREVDWDAIKKRIEGAVERGDLTRKEADAKYRWIKQRMKAGQGKAGERTRSERRITREDYKQAEVDVRQAVAEGKVSAEDARARLRAMRKAMADQGERGDVRSRWEGIQKRIEGAVKSGDMTRDEADSKYREIRERMGREDKREKPDWDSIKRRIEGAVERGDLAREEADAVYREIKKRMSLEEEPDALDWDAVERRIEGAVKRGDMTREEADAKYRELRK